MKLPLRWALFLMLFGLACSPTDLTSAPKEEEQIAAMHPPRADQPRISPVEKNEWTEAQRAYLEPYEQAGRLYNVFRTAARHPELARAFDAFALGHINGASNTLPARDRELVILRIGWLCRSEYEWAQHTRIARSIGFTEDEIARIVRGPDAPGWTSFEVTLLKAVDELHRESFITDRTWQALRAKYATQQLMDLVFTVGTYNLVSMVLNSWGVQLDEGLEGFPGRRKNSGGHP
jgi:4-carboxymuconolactone decarboxylase